MRAHNAMTRAWEIARAAAGEIGCKISEIHFGECLRLAWAEIKNTPSVDALLKIGKEWIKGDYHRIYFNHLTSLLGLEYTTYKTGNVSTASLNGASISNSQARRIINTLHGVKVWFDVKANEFAYKNTYGDEDGDEYAEQVIETLKAAR